MYGQLKRFITVHKRSLGQGNIFAPVCHSVHGGICPIACWDIPPGPEAGTPPPPGPEAGTPPPRADTPWDQRQVSLPRSRDTGNKRAVRILLQCNLVIKSGFIYFMSLEILYGISGNVFNIGELKT